LTFLLITMTNVSNEEQAMNVIHTTCQDIDNCSFNSWFQKFKSHTFKSKILPLSREFIDYLNAEGIYLPEEGY
jgi:hypothetical protein